MQSCDASDADARKRPEKRPYDAPKLLRYGDLRALTQGGGGTKADGGASTRTRS